MPRIDLIAQLNCLHQHLNLATQLLDKQYYKQAKTHIISALRIQPNSANALYLYSQYLKQTAPTSQWQQIIRKAYQLNPCFYQILNFDNKKIYKSILSSYKQTQQSFKQCQAGAGSKWIDIINIYSKNKDMDTCAKVLQVFDKVKQDDGSYSATTFSTMGLYYYQAGLYEQAYRKYQAAIAKLATQFRYYNNSAIIVYNMGKYQQTLRLVNRSLQIKPSYDKSMFIISFGLAKLGRTQQSLEKILSTLIKSPNSLLYRFKVITNLLLYFPNRTAEIDTHLQDISKIIQDGKDDDSYFYNKQNRPLLQSAAQFIKQYYKNTQIDQQDWKNYMVCFDNYLICGHNDKFRNKGKMMKLAARIKQKLDILKQNFNNLPDQLLEDQTASN